MSGASIAAEVKAALAEVAKEVGDGSFTVTILRQASPPLTPDSAPAGDPDEYELNAMVEAYRQDQIDGTLIRAGDRKVMMDATDIVPTTADRIVLPEGEFAILEVMPFAPSGVAIYHQLHCRK